MAACGGYVFIKRAKEKTLNTEHKKTQEIKEKKCGVFIIFFNDKLNRYVDSENSFLPSLDMASAPEKKGNSKRSGETFPYVEKTSPSEHKSNLGLH